MDTKLTLKLDQNIIERAKKYASEQKVSLSRLIEVYLQNLTNEEKTDEIEISTFVKSISTGKSMPANINYKEEYANYLVNKYK